MAIQNMTPWVQNRWKDGANQSMLGEEDPSAALDCMTFGDDSDALSTGLRPQESNDLPQEPSPLARAKQLRQALARWENEGGTDGPPVPHGLLPDTGQSKVDLTNAELVQMQIRVIALESLVTALLAAAPADVTALVDELAASIAPRAGCTPHHLTVHAVSHMLHLSHRAKLLRP